jgi:pyrroloquinoline quinone biosynthesis protein B
LTAGFAAGRPEIRVRLLGTAAGGGLPQWNCSCPNCQATRQGILPRRTQSCVAISEEPDHWFLINASPDFSEQLNGFPDLHPKSKPPRNSSIRGVFLTNSDLDHVLGLFSLREGDPLKIYAPAAVRASVTHALGLETVLKAFCGVSWQEPPTKALEPLEEDSTGGTGLRYKAIELSGEPPRFVRGEPSVPAGVHSVAYLFETARTKRRLLVAPDVAAVNPSLHEALASTDAVLFDGTFWSKDELRAIRPGAPEANEMGHVTIQDCSLSLLAGLRAENKVFIHINNTNPILMEGSAERKAVETVGLTVGWDGLEFEL